MRASERAFADDRGVVIPLVLAVVVASVLAVTALASVVGAGLRGSIRLESSVRAESEADAAVTWLLEQFDRQEVTPCREAESIVVPAFVAVDAQIVCVPLDVLAGHDVVLLIASAVSGRATSVIRAEVQVSVDTGAPFVLAWEVG